MGCKCKESSDKLRKYTEDGKPVLEPLKGFRKAAALVFRTIFGILCFLIVISVLPFVLLYIVAMTAFGEEVKINMKKLFRLNGGK